MKQINGHAPTIHQVADDPHTIPLDLATRLIQVSLQDVDLTVFTVLGPYHILKMPFTVQLSK
jgi:hypothetical protein